MEPASGEDWRQVPRPPPSGAPDHDADPAQQFARRKPQLAAAQRLHIAPPSGQPVSEFVALLPQPSALHAQPVGRAHRQEPAGIDDRRTPSALAHPAGPRAASEPARLRRGGCPPPPQKTAPPTASDLQRPADSTRPSVTQKWPKMNHAPPNNLALRVGMWVNLSMPRP